MKTPKCRPPTDRRPLLERSRLIHKNLFPGASPFRSNLDRLLDAGLGAPRRRLSLSRTSGLEGENLVCYKTPRVRRRLFSESRVTPRRPVREITFPVMKLLDCGNAQFVNEKNFKVDENVIQRRAKEIDRVKEKPIYVRYLSLLPKSTRQSYHPRTPNKHKAYSRRSWDALVRIWKKQLYQVCHEYDEIMNKDL